MKIEDDEEEAELKNDFGEKNDTANYYKNKDYWKTFENEEISII